MHWYKLNDLRKSMCKNLKWFFPKLSHSSSSMVSVGNISKNDFSSCYSLSTLSRNIKNHLANIDVLPWILFVVHLCFAQEWMTDWLVTLLVYLGRFHCCSMLYINIKKSISIVTTRVSYLEHLQFFVEVVQHRSRRVEFRYQ